jgi:hypothetical protein
MPITGAAIIGGGALVGGYLQGQAAQNAANTSANAQLAAAQAAAEAQKFRPVGITTNFGSSNFEFNPSGYLTGASYQLNPNLQAQQNQVMAGARTNLSDAEQLSNLGRSYLSQTPQEAAQNWLSQQNNLLQPSRELQRSQIQNSLFNSGRSGLSVAQGGGLGAANPEMQAYYNAIAQQDAQNALQAQQYGQQQVTFGQGLLTGAYAPYSNALGLASTIEQLGQSPLDIGAQLGGRSATAGANVGQTLFAGGTNAAKTLQAANSYSPLGSTISGLASNPAFANALAGQGQGNSGYTYNSPYGTNYGVTANYGVTQPSVWSSPDYTSGANYGYSSGGSYGLQPTGGTGFTF